MGEHSDWAGSYRRFNSDIIPGMCLVSGTNQGLYARVAHHPSHLVVSSVDHFGRKCGPVEIPMDPKTLLETAAEGGHFSRGDKNAAASGAVRKPLGACWPCDHE